MPVIRRPLAPPLFSGDLIVEVTHPDPHAGAGLQAAVDVRYDLIHARSGSPAAAPPAPLVERLIRHRSFADVAALEQAAASGPFPPLRSLNAYYRVWIRHVPHLALELLAALRAAPGVSRVWQELAVSAPTTTPGDDPHANEQVYLEAAPLGVGARAVAALPGMDGLGATLYDVELGWRRGHRDLVGRAIPAALVGDDAGEVHSPRHEELEAANHGTAVLGIIGAADDHAGFIGLAPKAALRLASCYHHATGSAEHVSDALCALLHPGERRAVILLEVQRGPGLPTEVEPPDLHAIRLAVSLGYTVIEAAGNGRVDLDHPAELGLPLGHPAWKGDSGAVLVGATGPRPPYSVLSTSNYGDRVDVFAHGAQVSAPGAAFGVFAPSPAHLDAERRDDFGGTSAAAAIIAGVALALLGHEHAAHRPDLSPADLREWLRAGPTTPGHLLTRFVSRIAHRLPGAPRATVGHAPDLAEVRLGAGIPRKHPLPNLPPVTLHAHPIHWVPSRPVFPGLRVPHDASQDAFVRAGAAGDIAAWVTRAPPVGAAGLAAPGHSPVAGPVVWREQWHHYDLAHTLAPGAHPPFITTWREAAGSAPRQDPRPGTPYQAVSTLELVYGAVPLAAPERLPLGGAPVGHFEVYARIAGLVAPVGELRRQHEVGPGGRQAHEWWVLWSNFVYLGGGGDRLELRFIVSPPPSSMQAWLDAQHAPAQGGGPPWFIEVQTYRY